MRVLGIVGSPREEGNTEIMMVEALASAKENGAEVEMMTLAGKQISGCQGCESCKKTGKCVIDDDMQMFYPKLVEADAIILGSPVYFWGITGQMKVFMDRTGPLCGAHGAILKDGKTSRKRQPEGLRNKIGGIIVVTRRAGATSVFAQIRAFSVFITWLNVVGPLVTAGTRARFAMTNRECGKPNMWDGQWLGLITG